MVIIPFVKKIGIIIDIKEKQNLKYQIYWIWENGATDIVFEDEYTINMWLRENGGKFGNSYHPVPK